MTTKRHAEANRRNAMRSTGPTTIAGRERSRMNALKHGLTAEEVTETEEEAAKFAAFRDDLIQDLAPVGALEEDLAQTVVTSSWRLRRVLRLEVSIITHHDECSLGVKKIEGPLHRFLMHRQYQSLTRYEIAQDRMRQRALHELQRLQAMRRGESVTAPVVVDVNHSIEAHGGARARTGGVHVNGDSLVLGSERAKPASRS